MIAQRITTRAVRCVPRLPIPSEPTVPLSTAVLTPCAGAVRSIPASDGPGWSHACCGDVEWCVLGTPMRGFFLGSMGGVDVL